MARAMWRALSACVIWHLISIPSGADGTKTVYVNTRSYTFTGTHSPEALCVSDVIRLPSFVQLSTSLILQLRLQQGPAEAPHFPETHAVRRNAREGNSGSELRIRSSFSGLLIPVSRGQSISRITEAVFLAWLLLILPLGPLGTPEWHQHAENAPSKLSMHENHGNGTQSNLGRRCPRNSQL